MEEASAIGGGTAFFMIAFAVIVDLVEAGLDLILIGFLLDPIIDVVAFMIFGIWFSHHGVSLLSSRNALRTLLTFLGKFVPIASIGPWWTVCVAYTIYGQQAE